MLSSSSGNERSVLSGDYCINVVGSTKFTYRFSKNPSLIPLQNLLVSLSLCADGGRPSRLGGCHTQIHPFIARIDCNLNNLVRQIELIQFVISIQSSAKTQKRTLHISSYHLSWHPNSWRFFWLQVFRFFLRFSVSGRSRVAGGVGDRADSRAPLRAEA